MLDRYDKNRAYVLDENTIKIIGEIERITKLASPYSEIHRLPELTDLFAKHFTAILDEECVPIEAAVREDWEAVKQEYTAQGLVNEFGEKVRSAFSGLVDRLSHAKNIFEAIAMKTESDRLKTRLMGEIANEAAKRAAVDNTDCLRGDDLTVTTKDNLAQIVLCSDLGYDPNDEKTFVRPFTVAAWNKLETKLNALKYTSSVFLSDTPTDIAREIGLTTEEESHIQKLLLRADRLGAKIERLAYRNGKRNRLRRQTRPYFRAERCNHYFRRREGH